tara:strand:+ start:279 stop:551 length:273 start_codon:yes stop_codon:yes gene_type:complete
MLKCPNCKSNSISSSGGGAVVLNTRNKGETPYLKRKRLCKACKAAFTTQEWEVGELQKVFYKSFNEVDLISLAEEMKAILKDLQTLKEEN